MTLTLIACLWCQPQRLNPGLAVKTTVSVLVCPGRSGPRSSAAVLPLIVQPWCAQNWPQYRARSCDGRLTCAVTSGAEKRPALVTNSAQLPCLPATACGTHHTVHVKPFRPLNNSPHIPLTAYTLWRRQTLLGR